MSAIYTLIIGIFVGLFIGLWSSNKYHEKVTKNRIKAGNFELEGKAYCVHAMEAGDM